MFSWQHCIPIKFQDAEKGREKLLLLVINMKNIMVINLDKLKKLLAHLRCAVYAFLYAPL
jgi:hypothetical protein